MSKIKISKREELTAACILLCGFMLLVFFIPLGVGKFAAILSTCILTVFISLFVLRENLGKIEYLTLPILPALFTLATALFYGIIPERWLTRIIIISIYGGLLYSILLIENVFNVAKIKNIQLLKVARTIYCFISSLTVFLFSYVILSFHLFSIITGGIFFFVILLISCAFFRSFMLSKSFTREEIVLSLSLALVIFEVAMVLSFWPLNIYLISLFLTSIYYSILGVWDHILGFRVKGWSIKEYIVINAVIFVLCLLTVNFG